MTIKKEIIKKLNKKITIDWIANNNGTDFFDYSNINNTQSFYNRNQKEIWNIINKQGGLIDFLKHDNDQQYIEDDKSFKSVLSWLSVEYVAQKMRDKL
jgi:hypothetical protein